MNSLAPKKTHLLDHKIKKINNYLSKYKLREASLKVTLSTIIIKVNYRYSGRFSKPIHTLNHSYFTFIKGTSNWRQN